MFLITLFGVLHDSYRNDPPTHSIGSQPSVRWSFVVQTTILKSPLDSIRLHDPHSYKIGSFNGLGEGGDLRFRSIDGNEEAGDGSRRRGGRASAVLRRRRSRVGRFQSPVQEGRPRPPLRQQSWPFP